jgi:ABC-type Fe3+/spermidine/putrescine transport system ATPase subunit
MSDIAFFDVVKNFGDFPAVRRMNFAVRQGEFVTLLGPSGCGKTTCLRMVAGFVAPSSGKIAIGGRDMTDVPPHRRNIGMVFQSYALFPHKTVAENIAFGLRVRRIGRGECRQRTAEALRLVRLEPFADRYPAQLSGGQRQRVALARAVVIRPDLLLLDEPLGALDLKLREELQGEIKRVQSVLGMTTLFVTHDQGEALSMSDRIAVMKDGDIVQIATPNVLYERPNCRYVANFVGKTNMLEVEIAGKTAAGYTIRRPGDAGDWQIGPSEAPDFAVGERCLLATRPEHVALSGDGIVVEGVVASLTYLGNLWQAEIASRGGEAFFVFLHPGDHLPARGEAVRMVWDPTRCFLLKTAQTPQTEVRP